MIIRPVSRFWPRYSSRDNLHKQILHLPSTNMRALTVDSLNPSIKNVQYAVRGELAIKAEAYRVQLQEQSRPLPFDRVISSNIGNPQQKGLDQPPITFVRQVKCLFLFLIFSVVELTIGEIDSCVNGMAGIG